MNLRRALSVAAGLLFAVAGVVGVSQPASATLPLPLPVPSTCLIQTYNTGNFLTAVGGGGQTTDAIHSNATWPAAWETFALVDAGNGYVGIRTLTGNYLTAVGGGGRTTDVIHTNATALLDWEKFNLVPIGDWFAIQTIDRHFLTAVGGGGQVADVIHSNATGIGAWELFRFTCITETIGGGE
jgi:hypothetical protein